MSSSSSRNCHEFLLDEIKDARNNFGKSKLLGHGGEAMVYLSEVNIDGKKTKVAVKHFNQSSCVLEKEIQTIPKIQHPEIVNLLGYCKESDQKILIYEYMKKGSLSDYVKGERSVCLSWKQRLLICIGAAHGLQHLHKGTKEFPFGIVHRDVKPGNILIDSNWGGRISDFGLFKLSHSGQEKSSMATEPKGTVGYYAPEYLECGCVTRRTDVYAFGVVLFEVLCHKKPWDRGDESYYRKDDEDLGLWAQKNVDIRIKEKISVQSLNSFTNIIKRSLKKEPNKRPTMDDVVACLERAFSYHNICMLAQKVRKLFLARSMDNGTRLLIEEELLTSEAEQLLQLSTGFLVTGSSHSIREGEQIGGKGRGGEKKNTEDLGIHAHTLVQLESKRSFTCDSCHIIDRGTRQSCPQCDFDLHEYCASCPYSQLSSVHPHTLNRGVHNKVSRRICDVCDDPIKGLYYMCSDGCNFDVHPLCTQLPPNINA